METFSPETLRLLQLTQLEILVAFGHFCDKHDLVYWLDSGTALGARRHGGFIPWDDDVDVGMMRADYDRMLELAADGLFPEGFSIHTFDNTPGFAGMFAKVYKDGTRFETQETRNAGCEQGIFIDVFPYDAVDADDAARKRQLENAYHWQKMSYLWHSGDIVVPGKGLAATAAKAACKVAHPLVRLAYSRDAIKRRFDDSCVCENPGTDVAIACYLTDRPIPRDMFVPPARAEFEGIEFPVPHDIDAYLEWMYGPTWCELPPEDERRTHAPLLLDFGD